MNLDDSMSERVRAYGISSARTRDGTSSAKKTARGVRAPPDPRPSAPAANTAPAPVGVAAAAGAMPTAQAGAAWAAPEEQGFMRQQPEAVLRQQWKEGRKDARLAYRKLHEDTMRQRRKDVESGRMRRGRER